MTNAVTTNKDNAYNNLGIMVYAAQDDDLEDVMLCAVDITTGACYKLGSEEGEKPLYGDDGQLFNLSWITLNNTGRCRKISCFRAFYFKDPNLLLGVMVKGKEGKRVTVMSRYAEQGQWLQGEETYPVLKDFAEGNGDMSINSLACNDSAISVGSYVHRPSFQSVNGKSYHQKNITQQGAIAFYSSYGVDDNGTPRPDVLTPGAWMMSAFSLYDTSYAADASSINSQNEIPVSHWLPSVEMPNGYSRPNVYGVMSGTSMSCPVTTGIVALWLQADPTLTVERIRELARQACLNDKWTTEPANIPSHSLVQAGLGKLDALRGLMLIENEKPDAANYQLNETVSLSANGIATFSSTHALDFGASTAPKAYVASKAEDGTVYFERMESTVEAGTGLLLTGTGTFEVPIRPQGTAASSNYLVGTASGAVTLDTEGMAYVLSKQNDKVGFYQNAANLTVPQGKAYLQLPDSQHAVRGYGIVFSEGNDAGPDGLEDVIEVPGELWHHFLHVSPDNETDAIRVLSGQPAQHRASYNLQGQRVDGTYKGIIISNGKKYLSR